MPRDEVHWSSSIRKHWWVWRWEATVYDNKYNYVNREITNHGYAYTYDEAEEKRNDWLRSVGELP